MRTERWRTSARLPGYEVSDLGRVRNIATRHVRKTSGHYPSFVMRYQKFYVHRLVCEVFHGPPPSLKHQVAHKNGHPADCHVGNLRWATPKENAADRAVQGTIARGAAASWSRLTEAQIIKIRTDPRAQRTIASDFGVSQHAIHKIKTRKTWSHV